MITGFWEDQPRPVETNLTVSPGGALRIQYSASWIECNAKDFILAALAGEVPRGAMLKWKDAVKEDLPDDSVIEITSSNTAGDQALVGVSAGTISIEDFVSADLKQTLKAVAQQMWNIRQDLDFIGPLRAAWWE